MTASSHDVTQRLYSSCAFSVREQQLNFARKLNCDLRCWLSGKKRSIINLATTSEGKRKLVIIYRGQFCPFCNGHLQEINAAIERLGDANIEVVAASADGIDATRGLIEKHGLTFTIGTGLSVDQMRTLGVYISDPTDQIEQTFKFAEPAFFLLNNDGTIRYISIANNPVAGRVNVDTLLMANAYVTSRSATDLKFAKVVWGSVL
eukprot:gene23752-30009_t